MPDSNIVPITSANAPRYKYYTVDIVSNKIVGEIPFEDVSYERSLKEAGAFDGKITISEQTNNLDLYNSTMPGRTALYVVRDNVATWGGIIWGRTYDLTGRSLSVSATEFTSYFNHRLIWKAYSNVYNTDLFKDTKTSPVLVSIKKAFLKAPLATADSFGNPNKVEVTFVANNDRKYTGFYRVLSTTTTPAAPADPSSDSFYVDIPKLPVPSTGVYNNVSVNVRVDTYGYLRDLLDNVFNDFINLDFPNEVIEPGITKEINITTKQLTISNNVYGIATLQCQEPHNLVVGQRVELANVDRMLDGLHTVTEIPTNKSLRFIVNNPVDARNRNAPIYLDNTLSTPVDTSSTIQRTPIYQRQSIDFLKENIIELKRVNGVVTLTLASPHQFELGTKIHIETVNKKPVMMGVYDSAKKKTVSTNTFKYNGNQALEIIAVTDNTISYADPKYKTAIYNVPLTKLSPLDLSKNYVQSSEPRGMLRIHSKNSTGFNINDRVNVQGVDSIASKYPRYNGNHRVYEVDSGVPFIVKQYEVVSDATYGTLIKFYVTKTNTLLIDSVISCEEGDNFLIAGMQNARDYLNGTYQAISDATPVGNYWVITADGPSEPVSLTNLTENATLSVNGTNWIQYFPAQSELRGAINQEPDSIFAITNLKYTPPKGKTPNTVTLTTKGRHLLNVGDKVKVQLTTAGTDSKDQDTYGGTFTVRAVNAVDRFSYSLRTKKDKNGAVIPFPTAATNQAKTGQITRFITNLEITKELVTARILSMATIASGDARKAYVYSPNHNLNEGEIIRIMFDRSQDVFKDLANDGDDIEIAEVLNENTFSYITNGQISKSKQYPLLGVEFNSSAYLKTTYPSDPEVSVANSIYYRIQGYTTEVNQPAVTVNVTAISSTGFGPFGGDSVLTTVTCDTDLTTLIKPGAGSMAGDDPKNNVVLKGLPPATYSSVTPSVVTPTLSSFVYSPVTRSIVFTCGTSHGLDSSFDGSGNAYATLESGPNFLVSPDFADRVEQISPGIYGKNMIASGIYGKNLPIAAVLDDRRFVVNTTTFGSIGFTAKNLNKLNAALTPSPIYPTLIGLNYVTSQITLTFAADHNLDSVNDFGANLSIDFVSSVEAANNSTGATLDTSWISNSNYRIVRIPDSRTVVVYTGSSNALNTNPISISNIGGVGSTTNTTVTRRASTITHALNAVRITLNLDSPLPFKPDANTSVTISSITSFASYPFETDRVGGVNTSVMAGAKTLIFGSSTASSLVVEQAGYTPAFTVYGSAASSAQIVVSYLSNTSSVPIPSITINPNPVSNAGPFVLRVQPANRQVQQTPDLAIYNNKAIGVRGVSGNTFTFLDAMVAFRFNGGGGVANLISITPKPTAFVPAQTWVESNAPVISIGEQVSVLGMQDNYAFLNDFNLTVDDYWPGDFLPGAIPTSYVRVKNPYYTDSRKTMPPNKTSGLPDTATMFSNTELRGTAYVVPAENYEGSSIITRISRSSDGTVATITSPNHDFVVGDEVYVYILGLEYAAFSKNLQRIKIESVTENTFSYKLSVNTRIKSFSGSASQSIFDGLGSNELNFSGDGSHNLVSGDVVSITGVSAFVNGSQLIENTSGGSVSISTSETGNFVRRASTTGLISVTEYVSVDTNVTGYAIKTPMAIRRPQLLYRTYGEFPRNASIGGLTFSTNNFSANSSSTTPIYGSQLVSVADILEGYSNTIDGFDYRIDVNLKTNLDGTKTFERKFVLLPIYPPTLTEYLLTLPNQKLARGQVAHPRAFGADKLIFEYPGGISNVSMSENAENAATRVFVVGNDNQVGSGSEVAYSGASEVSLLADGWPLLDKKETKEWPIQSAQSARVDPIDNYDDETAYWQYAERFLKESKPPVGDFVISVNGSLNPVIGSYNPGDWCSIVINDNFVKTRLNSVLEPRKDVIVRKIDSIKVQVPNNPAFPEQIDLQLVTDWQVDKIGE